MSLRHKVRHARTSTRYGLLVAAILLFAACSSSARSNSTAQTPSTGLSQAGPTSCQKIANLTLVTLGLTTDAVIPLGTGQGFFAKHCLRVTTVQTTSGAAAIADLLGGSADVAYSSEIPLLSLRVRWDR